MPRVKGYHYVRGKDGRKRRVYGARSGRQYGASRRRGTSRSAFGRVYGRGAYYTQRKRAQQGGRVAMVNRPNGGGRRGSGLAVINFGGTDPPKMGRTKFGFTVSHREYIQDITSSVPFIPENFPLNPGIPQTFPWLAQIAENFEEWIPNAIVLEYKTTSSNTVVNTTNSNPGLGTVIIATQYNSLNNQFGSKQQMENYENAVSSDPSRSVIHPVECARKQTPLEPMYVRTGPLEASATRSNDLRFYDLGVTTVATIGQQTNNFVIGELWISYSITFLKPKLLAGKAVDHDGVIDKFQMVRALNTYMNGFLDVKWDTPFGVQNYPIAGQQGSTLGGIISGGAVTTVSQQNVKFPESLGGDHPFYIFPIVNGKVDVGLPAGNVGIANTYYFPPGITTGRFLFIYTSTYQTAGVPAQLVVVPAPLTTGCHLAGVFGGDSIAYFHNAGTGNTTSSMLVACVDVITNYAHVTIQAAAGASLLLGPITADLSVIKIPDGISFFQFP